MNHPRHETEPNADPAPPGRFLVSPDAFALPGWREERCDHDGRRWRNEAKDEICLSSADVIDPPVEPTALRQWARGLAERSDAGLIEVTAVRPPAGPGVAMIYKQLEPPAYVYTGLLFVPEENGHRVWRVVAKERGMTGRREAVAVASTLGTGLLTLAEFERAWARDPYDPSYRGVDRRLLRFVTDDETFDKFLPDDPLRKVRETLAYLTTGSAPPPIPDYGPLLARASEQLKKWVPDEQIVASLVDDTCNAETARMIVQELRHRWEKTLRGAARQRVWIGGAVAIGGLAIIGMSDAPVYTLRGGGPLLVIGLIVFLAAALKLAMARSYGLGADGGRDRAVGLASTNVAPGPFSRPRLDHLPGATSFCPRCHAQYLSGAEVCSVCDVELSSLDASAPN